MTTRQFQADHASFVVSCPTSEACETIERAFSDLPIGHASEPVVIRLQSDGDGSFTVLVDDELRFSAQRGNQALGSIVTSVTRIALDADPERLHLHCAAVSKNGRGALITARSGTGKTTLTAKLLTRGWSYGSDESVAIDPGSMAVATFPKPLMVKNGGAGPMAELAASRVALDPDDDHVWTVPASAVATHSFDSMEPRLIVVLVQDHGGALGLLPSHHRRIHPADAVVAMMQQTMDASRFGPRAVEVLAGLAARSHCVQLRVGPLEPAADAMEALLAEGSDAREIKLLAPSHFAPELPWHVSEHVRSILLDDRVVVHDTSGGAVSAFDEAGTAVWLTLLGEPPEGWNSAMLQHQTMQGFMAQLLTLGFVHTGERHSVAP